MDDYRAYEHAWIDVGHGDVQASHPRVPELPDGRYVHRAVVDGLREQLRNKQGAVGALLGIEQALEDRRRKFGKPTVEDEVWRLVQLGLRDHRGGR